MGTRTKNLSLLIFCAGLLSLVGCAQVLPQSNDLDEVHRIYRDEFTESQIPGPRVEQSALVPQAITPGKFDRTLAAIADFRRRYPDAKQENNHLIILEGMIFLQSRQFGLARLASADIEAAGKSLTNNQASPRDALFSASFRNMVDGWELIAREERDKKDASKKDAEKFAIGNRGKEDVAALTSAATGIRSELCTRRDAGRLARSEGDQGATYLAATAATFLIWADKANESMCFRGLPDGECMANRRATPDRLYQARDMVRTFLPPTLQRAADSGRRLDPDGSTSGATRYLQITEFASERIRARTGGDLRPMGDACR